MKHQNEIAAAPELLEACESALGWLTLSDVQYLISHKLGEQAALQKTLGELRAAIRSAKLGVAPSANTLG